MVVLRLVHLSCSLGHASQSDHIFHCHHWTLPINELLQCSRERICKFSSLQKACVSGLCVGMFVAMLRKKNISFLVVKSAKLLLHSPHSLHKDPSNFVLHHVVCCVLCVVCSTFITVPWNLKALWFCFFVCFYSEPNIRDTMYGCYSSVNLYRSQRCHPNLQPFIC